MGFDKGVIDDSDYYVLVVGGRYGSTSAEGISYTEMEFDYARTRRKPILAFVHQNPDLIPAGKTDLSDAARAKLESFRSKVETGRHVKYWTNPDDLRAKVIQSISAKTKRNPQEGWVRAGRAVDPTLLETLRGQVDDLRAELAVAKLEAPSGSEDYAGGIDEFGVNFTNSVWKDGGYNTTLHEIIITWNTIFFEIGPLLMEEAAEQQMKQRLSSEIWRYNPRDFPPGGTRSITDESFDTIKVQLFALGLTQKSPKKHVPSDTNRYWSLTPYGETTLMKLRAIPKSEGAFLLGKDIEDVDDRDSST